jgi:polyisoprenyl-teichoic acid--peptidoglycan teichoic acid transferase
MVKTKRRKMVKSRDEQMVIEAQKPARFTVDDASELIIETKRPSLPWWVIGIISTILLFIVIITVFIWSYISRFEAASEVSAVNILEEVRNGLKHKPFEIKGRYTILILGIDEIANQREGSLLTDTMILATIQESGVVTLISLPRDLWIDSLKTKVNALYYYGETGEDSSGPQLVSTVVEDITGIKVDYYVLVSMETVKNTVDAVGGIPLNVPESFSDPLFPRSDVDTAGADMSALYETVSFSAGEQVFDGDMALKYIRSRHSSNTAEGNDMARTRRQQAVIGALVNAISSKQVVLDPTRAGALLKLFNRMNTDLDLTTIVSLGRALAGKPITLATTQIPVTENGSQGILFVPPISKYGQWVYEPVDPTFEQLQFWVADELNHLK